MFNLLSIGVQVKAEQLSDEIAQQLSNEIQLQIENAVKQIVFDLGENGSGYKLQVIFN